MTDTSQETRRGKLKVWFEDPRDFVIAPTSELPLEVWVPADHIVYPTLEELAGGLSNLLSYGGAADVHCEDLPWVRILRFARSGTDCTLQIDVYRDCRRLPGPPDKTVLHATGSVNEIIAPFWRALSNLQGRYSELELSSHLSRHGFPAKETEMLGQLLKNHSKR